MKPKTSALWNVTLAATLVAAATLGGGDASAASGTNTLRYSLQRQGLSFTGPCRSVVYRVDRGADPTEAVENLSNVTDAELELKPGKYHAWVTCPSTEGALSKTFPVDLRSRGADIVSTMEPGFVLAEVQRNGSVIDGVIRVVDAFGRELLTGKPKAPLPVVAGKVTIVVETSMKMGRKTVPLTARKAVRIQTGKKQQVAFDVSDATVTVDLRDNGKKTEGLATLMEPNTDNRVVELRVGEPAQVPPGTYDLVTQLEQSHDFHSERKKKITVLSNSKKTLRANHATGGVLPVPILDGKRLNTEADGEKIDVALYLGAAPKEFNILDAGEEARLRPGRYRVAIKRAALNLDDGSPWVGSATVDVRAGRTRTLQINVTPARWKLVTSLSGTKRAIDIAVFTEKGSAPLISRKTDDGGLLSLALPSGIYRVVGTVKAPQGDIVREARVSLKDAKTRQTKLDFDLGIAVIQVMDEGVAVPAKVSFFARGASEPLLTVSAGGEALLPPGRYSLRVKRRKKTKTFSEIVVARGRPAERTLEFSTGTEPPAPKDDKKGAKPKKGKRTEESDALPAGDD